MSSGRLAGATEEFEEPGYVQAGRIRPRLVAAEERVGVAIGRSRK